MSKPIRVPDSASALRTRRIPSVPPPPSYTALPREATLRDGWSQANVCEYRNCDCPADHA